MESTYAENREPETRKAQGSESNIQRNDGSEGGAKGDSGKLGNISERIAGTGRSQENQISSGEGYLGGMLDQMIQDCGDRLEEAEACLVWYENVKRRELRRMENLRHLQELKRQEEERKQSNPLTE